MIEKETAYIYGYNAYLEGKGQERNPFKKATEAEQWWSKGWSDAQSDEEGLAQEGKKVKPLWRKRLETLITNAWEEMQKLLVAAMIAWILLILPVVIFEGLRPWGWWIFGVIVAVLMIIEHRAQRIERD